VNTEVDATATLVKVATEISKELGAIVLKLLTNGLPKLAALIVAACTPTQGNEAAALTGRQKIEKLLGGDELPAIFQVPHEDMAAFKAEAKKFRLPYAIVRDDNTPGADIVIRAKDSTLFTRVFERLGYGHVDINERDIQENPTKGKPVSREVSGTDSPTQRQSARDTAESAKTPTFDRRSNVHERQNYSPNKRELKKIIKDHKAWLDGNPRGKRADLTGADLRKAKLTGVDLTGANLNHANLSGAKLTGADLTGADLRGAKLSDAKLTGANLSDADLNRADLNRADLSGAKLSGANLTDAYMWDAKLTGAKLTGAKLTGADLSGADLEGADLTHANLSGTNLSHTNLEFADLRNAELTGADLTRAHLTGAHLPTEKRGEAIHKAPAQKSSVHEMLNAAKEMASAANQGKTIPKIKEQVK
jgi:uncharacterized protein YjbI with pentapeptide repeats